MNHPPQVGFGWPSGTRGRQWLGALLVLLVLASSGCSSDPLRAIDTLTTGPRVCPSCGLTVDQGCRCFPDRWTQGYHCTTWRPLPGCERNPRRDEVDRDTRPAGESVPTPAPTPTLAPVPTVDGTPSVAPESPPDAVPPPESDADEPAEKPMGRNESMPTGLRQVRFSTRSVVRARTDETVAAEPSPKTPRRQLQDYSASDTAVARPLQRVAAKPQRDLKSILRR